jgi:hypothetical protein
MTTIPLRQSVDVHWRPRGLDGMREGREHQRSFDNLVGAAKFAIEKGSENCLSVRLCLAVGPSLNLAQAEKLLELSRMRALQNEDAIALENLQADAPR